MDNPESNEDEREEISICKCMFMFKPPSRIVKRALDGYRWILTSERSLRRSRTRVDALLECQQLF